MESLNGIPCAAERGVLSRSPDRPEIARSRFLFVVTLHADAGTKGCLPLPPRSSCQRRYTYIHIYIYIYIYFCSRRAERRGLSPPSWGRVGALSRVSKTRKALFRGPVPLRHGAPITYFPILPLRRSKSPRSGSALRDLRAPRHYRKSVPFCSGALAEGARGHSISSTAPPRGRGIPQVYRSPPPPPTGRIIVTLLVTCDRRSGST